MSVSGSGPLCASYAWLVSLCLWWSTAVAVGGVPVGLAVSSTLGHCSYWWGRVTVYWAICPVREVLSWLVCHSFTGGTGDLLFGLPAASMPAGSGLLRRRSASYAKSGSAAVMLGGLWVAGVLGSVSLLVTASTAVPSASGPPVNRRVLVRTNHLGVDGCVAGRAAGGHWRCLSRLSPSSFSLYGLPFPALMDARFWSPCVKMLGARFRSDVTGDGQAPQFGAPLPVGRRSESLYAGGSGTAERVLFMLMQWLILQAGWGTGGLTLLSSLMLGASLRMCWLSSGPVAGPSCTLTPDIGGALWLSY